MAPEIVRAIEVLMKEEGVSLGDLLNGLDRQREGYVREKYGVEA